MLMPVSFFNHLPFLLQGNPHKVLVELGNQKKWQQYVIVSTFAFCCCLGICYLSFHLISVQAQRVIQKKYGHVGLLRAKKQTSWGHVNLTWVPRGTGVIVSEQQ